MNLRTVKWAQCDKTQYKQLRTVHLCVLMTPHSFSTQYNTEQLCYNLLPPDKRGYYQNCSVVLCTEDPSADL